MKFQTLTGKWQFRQAGAKEWLPATVPGGAHTDLLNLGLIPDPFIGDNEKKVMWVAESDWEYAYTFTPETDVLAEGKIFLVADGLDTLARVTLNGAVLGETANEFRQYRWEVKENLHGGENRLEITFSGPAAYAAAAQNRRPMKGVSQTIEGAPHIRKAPCQFGWDWGPMLPSIGVWRDIRLEGRSIARFEDVHLKQIHEEGNVTIEATLNVQTFIQPALGSPKGSTLNAFLKVTAPNGDVLKEIGDISGGVIVQPPLPPNPGGSNTGFPQGWVEQYRLPQLWEDDSPRIGGRGAERLPGYRITLKARIEAPQLWWPNGLGAQNLYDVAIVLKDETDILDKKEYKIGLRTIELRQEDDEYGKSFQFVVNGVPIFAKGSNWIPADCFVTRFSDERLEKLIADAAASHQNMLRVWGGGLYEEERFYDLCDRYGLLVWQDFTFACSIYPLDDADFHENVRIEAEQNIRRLRHRACLALWCGNNEMEEGWESWGWAKHPLEDQLPAMVEQYPVLGSLLELTGNRNPLEDWEVLKDAYDQFFHQTLPEWVVEFDPDTPYWPSSPSSDTPFRDTNGQSRGDAHFWDVWHGRQPFTAYRDSYPRFMSEFGFQAFPTMETVEFYAAPEARNLTSYIMEHHQRGNHGNGLIIAQMTDTFLMPKDFAAWIYLSLILQAEGIRYGVEHWRRNMHRVAGTLYWQLNDCWPVASWASIDYFGRWKALHYLTRRFYAPVLLSIEDKPPVMDVHVSSDLTEPWEGALKWTLENLTGEAVDCGSLEVTANPLANTPIHSFDFSDRVNPENERGLVFVCELWQGDECISLSVTPFVPNKHLKLKAPNLKMAMRISEGGFDIELTAQSLARFVELKLAGADVIFNDNYFDVPAGRMVRVTCPVPEGWTLEKAMESLKVCSLFDSF